MNLAELSKAMHAARLCIDGSFRSQRAACKALGIPIQLAGRVSDAHTILVRGIPELIAAVESGQLALQTGWHIAQEVPREEQLAVLDRAQTSPRHGRESHGLYIGHGRTTGKMFQYQNRQRDRMCEAVDKLLDAIVERADALGVCTNGTQPAPEPEQGRKWRIAIRRCRRALLTLERRIDWTKTENANEPNPIEEGDRQDHVTINGYPIINNNNNNGPQD
jgi:hypothetical protein